MPPLKRFILVGGWAFGLGCLCLPALLADLAAAEVAGFEAPTAKSVQARMATAKADSTLLDRLIYLSDPFVGAPYVVSPLGEGAGEDTDPRIRFDAFDCTTFVETTMALLFSPDLDGALERLNQIRYRGVQRDFLNRRHFPAAEWIPDLIQAGYFHDITRKVGGRTVKLQSKILNAKVWNQRRKPRHFNLPDERIPSGKFSVPTWPLVQALEHFKKIPPGTVLNVVRVNFRQMPVRVSHQGIVIRKNKNCTCGTPPTGCTTPWWTSPWGNFLARISLYQKWPVQGINLLKITRPYATAHGAPVELPVSPISTTKTRLN